MRVAILGAGAIAFATAAWLVRQGHEPILWSPSGRRTQQLAAGEKLRAEQAIEGEFAVAVAATCATAVTRAEVVMLAVPGYAHKAVLDAAAPHLREAQPVIISSHVSFSGLYLSRLLVDRGVQLPIITWGTTLVTGRQPDETRVEVSSVRKKVDMATLPHSGAAAGLALCTQLFGERFVLRDGLLAIALSNLNPQNHLGIALLNLTRMERGEHWNQSQNVTPAVGRLIEALDAERLALAEVFGLSVKTVREHFSLSFHVPEDSVSAMNQTMFERGSTTPGPATADSRYVLEDVPYGLLPTVRLGRLAGRPAALHAAGISLFSAAYGRDFESENNLLPALGLTETTSVEALIELTRNGYSPR